MQKVGSGGWVERFVYTGLYVGAVGAVCCCFALDEGRRGACDEMYFALARASGLGNSSER